MPSAIAVPKSISQNGAARLLGVHPNTVGNMLSDGRLEAVGSPKRRRVCLANLLSVLDGMFGPVICGDCSRLTLRFEAHFRRVHTNRCGHCGGHLYRWLR